MIIPIHVDGKVKDWVTVTSGEPESSIKAKALEKVHLTRDDIVIITFSGTDIYIVCKFID